MDSGESATCSATVPLQAAVREKRYDTQDQFRCYRTSSRRDIFVPAASAKDLSPANAAVADLGRPAADTALDAQRKPAEVLKLIGIKPGDKVMDLFAGAYWDRLFSKMVGPSGKVIAFQSVEMAKAIKQTSSAQRFRAVSRLSKHRRTKHADQRLAKDRRTNQDDQRHSPSYRNDGCCVDVPKLSRHV